MKFKNYKRKYEKVFSDMDVVEKKFKIDRVSSFNNIPGGLDEYMGALRDTINGMHNSVFDHLVKYIWLTRRFTYDGKRRKNFFRNGIYMDRAFGIFMRSYVGFENRFIMSTYASGGKIASYFDDFFPNFDNGNPFKEDYRYPYKNITLEYLMLVYQMEERLGLLEFAEEKGMSYTTFLDFVINYISCYNEEHGEKYIFVFSSTFMPYVKVNKNYEESTKASNVCSGD